jgi:diacylglycerol kinase family enzyme
MADHFEPRKVDLGDANGRKFIFAAGAGLDAEIVENCESHPTLKKRFGQNYYLMSAVTKFTRHLGHRAELEIEVAGETTKGIVAIAQNGRPFTYFGQREIDLAPGAGLEKRSLSLTTLDRANPLDFIPIVTRLLSQKSAVAGNRHIRILDDFDKATITRRRKDGKKIALQTDGDYIGHFDEVTFTALPAALSVVA